MKRVNAEELEKYDAEKFCRCEIFRSERAKTLLLTLLPGQSVPEHRHTGWEVILQPVRGEAEVTLDEETMHLRVGELIFADGATSFALANRKNENFAALITLIKV